jgi:hypothetical protein
MGVTRAAAPASDMSANLVVELKLCRHLMNVIAAHLPVMVAREVLQNTRPTQATRLCQFTYAGLARGFSMDESCKRYREGCTRAISGGDCVSRAHIGSEI